jgi:hypothetical protein
VLVCGGPGDFDAVPVGEQREEVGGDLLVGRSGGAVEAAGALGVDG